MLLRKPKASDPVFPGYNKVVEIGKGRFSSVYSAFEIDTHRSVALKLLDVSNMAPHVVDSFDRETRALGELSAHPNILTLYRAFLNPAGRPVLVLELCHGTLSDVLRGSGPLDARHVVSIGIKIASALETAHRAGILHSDVKPQNILMTRYSEPVLSDFGVARIQSSSQATAGVLGFSTIHGAPELLEGTPITASADIYALASTMYQLISGKAAFAAAEDEASASVILRSLRDPVAPLVGPGVPIALSDLLIRSMDKAASVRPGSASELAEELAVISFDDEPTRMGDGARKHSSFETIAPSLPHSRTRCWGSGPD